MRHSNLAFSTATLLVLAIASLSVAAPADKLDKFSGQLIKYPQFGTALRIRNYGMIRIVDAKDSSIDYGCVTSAGNARTKEEELNIECGSFLGGYNAQGDYELISLPINDVSRRCYMEITSFRCTADIPATGSQLDLVNELYLRSTQYNSLFFDFWKPSPRESPIIYSAAQEVYDATQGRQKMLKFAYRLEPVPPGGYPG